MPAAYAVFIRERTRNAAQLDEYRKMVPASFQKHPAVIRARPGRFEVLEGPISEGFVIIEFPAYDAALDWYNSADYQAVREHRFQGADYRCILTDGV